MSPRASKYVYWDPKPYYSSQDLSQYSRLDSLDGLDTRHAEFEHGCSPRQAWVADAVQAITAPTPVTPIRRPVLVRVSLVWLRVPVTVALLGVIGLLYTKGS